MRFGKFGMFFSLLAVSQLGFAGTGSGRITGFLPYAIGADEVIIVITQSISGTPACNNTLRFIMKSSDLKFKGTRAAAMAAYVAGSPVIVRGANTCNIAGNTEDMTYLCVGSIPC